MSSEKMLKNQRNDEHLEDPAFVRNLFSGVKLAWIWLLGLYLGVNWLHAG